VKQYLNLLNSWNKTHRIIGSNADDLFNDCVLALKNSQLPQCENIIDLGAGSGIVGFSFLSLYPNAHVTFVEPLHKKVSFLNFVKSELKLSNIKIIAGKIEDVSRETNLWNDNEPVVLTRAFSGNKSLEQTMLNLGYKWVFNYIVKPQKVYKRVILK